MPHSPHEHTISNNIKNGIHAQISISSQQSWNAKNKKNNIIIHQPAPKNPPSHPQVPKNLPNLVLPPC